MSGSNNVPAPIPTQPVTSASGQINLPWYRFFTSLRNDAITALAGMFTVALFAKTDLSSLPTADPGRGRPWLKAGGVHVGP